MTKTPALPPVTPVGENKSGTEDGDGQERIIVFGLLDSDGNLEKLSSPWTKDKKRSNNLIRALESRAEELDNWLSTKYEEPKSEETQVDDDLYNESGNMGVERGNGAPGTDPEIDQQQSIEVIPENTNRYEQAIEGLPLMGKRPEFIVLDQDGDAYLSRNDAAGMAEVSERYIGDLVARKQVQSTTLNGRERYIDLNSLIRFLLHDRRPRGRPRKNHR